MNLEIQDYYDELYRIFSCVDSLLTQAQMVMLGECLRSLLAGENISYKLERLYRSVENNPKISEPLENFMHHYTTWVEDNDINENNPKQSKEDSDYAKPETVSDQITSNYQTTNSAFA